MATWRSYRVIAALVCVLGASGTPPAAAIQFDTGDKPLLLTITDTLILDLHTVIEGWYFMSWIKKIKHAKILKKLQI